MAIALPDARELADDVLEALRLRAVRGCQLGFTETELADLLGVRRETVCHWWSAYVDGGLDALPHDRTGRPVGSRRALSDEQAARIQQLLRTYQPEELGVPAALWSRRAVGERIRKEFGIVVAVRTVGLYLQRWGFTAKRPRRHARDQDPEEVRQWLEETYPAIENRAKQEEAEIYWVDEVGMAAWVAWLASHGERVELFYLPRYAPELNADEYLNNDLKGQVNAAGLPHSKVEVRSRIQDFMRKLLHLPQHVMSYFEHPSVQYAANMNM